MTMKNYITLLLFGFIFNLSLAQANTEDYKTVVQTFIHSIKTNNSEQLKTQVSYPLRREYPLSKVKNETEFVNRFKEIFDDSLIDLIVNSDLENDWSPMGWRGIMLNRGSVWLDYDGKLLAVNYQSNTEKLNRLKLIETDKKAIHKKLATFKQPTLILETAKFKVRIDELENGMFRYASWPISADMTDTPDLILTNGKNITDGSGGNHYYEFSNGKYKYVCYINQMGSDDSAPADLTVYKNEKIVLEQPAVLLKH